MTLASQFPANGKDGKTRVGFQERDGEVTMHPSNVKDIAEIQGYKCGKEKCACNSEVRLHCPLCDPSRLTALTLNRLRSHIDAVHWNHKLHHKDVFILCCNLSCGAGNHFHCPTCTSVHSRLSRIKQHLEDCTRNDDAREANTITQLDTIEMSDLVPPSSVKTEVPLEESLQTTAEMELLPSRDVEMQNEISVISNENDILSNDDGTVYIIQDGDMGKAVIEAIRRAQLGNLEMSADPAVMDSSENIVMVLNHSGAAEQLQNGNFIIQAGDNLEHVVLYAEPDNETENGIEHSIGEETASCGAEKSCDTNEEEMDTSAYLQTQLGQYYHESFIMGFTDLTSMISETGPHTCPMCDDLDDEEIQYETVDQVKSHLEQMHWKMKIDHMGFSIVSCGLPCSIDKPLNTSDFHWHCPHCWMTADYASMKSHVRSHTEITNFGILDEQDNTNKKTVNPKQTSAPPRTGPLRRRGRPKNSERVARFAQEILDEVIEAVVTGKKSWEEECNQHDGEDDVDEKMDTENATESEVVQPEVVPRFGEDGRELVIRTRRQHNIESGVSPPKHKRKFIEIDSDDEVMVDDDDDVDYKVPELLKKQRYDAEERSLELLLLAAEKTEPKNAENMQIAVSSDGTLLLHSMEDDVVNAGVKSKHKLGSYENVVCPSCQRPFRKKQLFYQHLFNSKCHKNAERLPAEMLEMVQDAMKTVTGVTCPLCGKDFCDMQHTRVHYALRTCQNTFVGKMGYTRDNVTGKYKCNSCDYSSVNPRVLVAHEAREHVDKKDYECSICHRKYAFHVLLQRHLKTTHFAPSLPKCQCDICGKTMYTKHIKQHMRMSHDPNFVRTKEPELAYFVSCDMCEFKTTFRKKLEIHKQRMHGEKNKECEKCGKSFSLRQDLTAHVKICSVGPEGQEECPHCGKKLLKKNLKNHIDLVHRNNRRHECQICGKKFQTKYVLQCHLDTHRHPSERIPKFLCGTCGKGFTNRTMLSDHINVHTGNTPYVCKYCDRRFKCGPSLHRHQELHTGIRYNCRVCGSMFTTKSYWKQHMKKHDQDLILRCDCGKEYQTHSGLRNHRQTCSAVVDTELAVEQLETQTVDGTTFLWSEEDQQVLQVSSQEIGGETLVVLETIDGEAREILSTPVAGDDGEVVTIVQSDDQVVMETSLADEMLDQQVALETTEVMTDDGQDQFLCGHCQQMFSSMEEVQEHMLSHFEELGVGEEVNLAIQASE